MLSALAFLAVLSVLVLLHELGHYLVAKAFGVRAYEFGFGFPPRGIGFVKINGKWRKVGRQDRTLYPGTVWSINWLPLGGFVRLKGESAEDGKDADSLLAQNGWKKFAILAAGVTMNWILAAAIFCVGFSIGVPAVTNDLPANAVVSDRHVEIMDVVPGSAAASAGLIPGDRVRSINGQVVMDAEKTRALLGEHTNTDQTITLGIGRPGKDLLIQAKPAYLEALKRAGLGVALADTGTVRFPGLSAIGEGVGLSVRYTGLIVVGFFTLIRDLVLGHGPSAELSGPLGIAAMTGGIVRQGIWATMQFAAILSLNLAVINFLPIPALDGGRAVFVILDAVRRKRSDGRIEAQIHQWGMVALLILVALVTINDIRRIFFH